MVTARDLLEAAAFERRRLTTALVCGATGDGAGPPRPGRALVAGLLLAALLAAAVLLADLVDHASRPDRGSAALSEVAVTGLLVSPGRFRPHETLGRGGPSAR